MTEVEHTLKRDLREPQLVAADAVWQRIQARRGTQRSQRVMLPVLVLSGALLAVGAYLLRAPAALTLHDGAALAAMQTGTQARSFVLSDNSRLELSPNTRLVPQLSKADAFVTELAYGHVLFDVVPGGPRRWTIHAADLRVDVLGTRFSVERTNRAVSVAVQRGSVAVTDGKVTKRLSAGQAWTIESGDAAAALVPASPPTAATRRSADRPQPQPLSAAAREADGSSPSQPLSAAAHRDGISPPPPPPSAAARRGGVGPQPPPLSAAASGDANRPLAAPEASATQPSKRAASVETLLARADAARRAGQLAAAARTLAQIVEQHPDDPRAALAAFTLGRLYLDPLAHPAQAAAAFARARALGLPQALAEEAAAREVQGYARAGEPARARTAAADYSTRYPQGNHRREVESWASPQ